MTVRVRFGSYSKIAGASFVCVPKYFTLFTQGVIAFLFLVQQKQNISSAPFSIIIFRIQENVRESSTVAINLAQMQHSVSLTLYHS